MNLIKHMSRKSLINFRNIQTLSFFQKYSLQKFLDINFQLFYVIYIYIFFKWALLSNIFNISYFPRNLIYNTKRFNRQTSHEIGSIREITIRRNKKSPSRKTSSAALCSSLNVLFLFFQEASWTYIGNQSPQCKRQLYEREYEMSYNISRYFTYLHYIIG